MFWANLADFDRKGFTNIPPPLLEDYTKIQKKILSFDLKDLNLSWPIFPYKCNTLIMHVINCQFSCDIVRNTTLVSLFFMIRIQTFNFRKVVAFQVFNFLSVCECWSCVSYKALITNKSQVNSIPVWYV